MLVKEGSSGLARVSVTGSCNTFTKDFELWCDSEPGEIHLEPNFDKILFYGEIPADLDGVWYRNGPGRLKVGASKAEVLDGDGQVFCVPLRMSDKIQNNNIQNILGKYIKTEGYLKDTKTRSFNQRGAFGTCANGWFRNVIPDFKNVANTNLVYWNGLLLALWEGGLPHSLNPRTLETVENNFTFSGVIGKLDTFGAHPKIMPAYTGSDTTTKGNNLINIGTNLYQNYLQHPWQHRLKVWEIDERSQLSSKHSIPLARSFAFIHDFSVTDCYIIVPQSPVKLNPARLFFGGGVSKAFQALDEMLYLHVIPRQTKGRSNSKCCVFAVPRAFVFHCVNSFEDANGNVVVDVIAYKEMPSFEKLMSPENCVEESSHSSDLQYQIDSSVSKVLRYRLPIKKRLHNHGWDGTKSMHEYQIQPEILFGAENRLDSVEFPCLNPQYEGKKYRYAYCIDTTRASELSTENCFTSIIKLDLRQSRKDKLRSWKPRQFTEERTFVCDPVFVSRQKKELGSSKLEDEGYLITSVFHAGCFCKSTISIINAENMSTIAILNLGFPVPISLHTLFVNREEITESEDAEFTC